MILARKIAVYASREIHELGPNNGKSPGSRKLHGDILEKTKKLAFTRTFCTIGICARTVAILVLRENEIQKRKFDENIENLVAKNHRIWRRDKVNL